MYFKKRITRGVVRTGNVLYYLFAENAAERVGLISDMFVLKSNCVRETKHLEPLSEYVKTIEVLICSDSAQCPNSFTEPHSKENRRSLGTRKLENEYGYYEIKDITEDGKAVKFRFRVQKWICDACYFRFLDPAFTYPKNTKTTDEYLEYAVRRFLENSQLDIPSLTQKFEINDHQVEHAIRNYRNKCKSVYKAMPPCRVVWLLEIDYRHSKHILALGESRHDGEFILLGFCDAKFDTAESTFRLNEYRTKPDVIYANTQDLIDAAEKRGYEAKKYHDDQDEIERLLAIIQRFEAAKVRSDFMKFRLEFQNHYRRREVQAQHNYDFMQDMSSAIHYKTPYSSHHSRDHHAFIVREETGAYFGSSLRELLKFFGEDIDRPKKNPDFPEDPQFIQTATVTEKSGQMKLIGF